MVTHTLTAGTELAGYRIEGVAGEGGMGVVYRATQLALGRPVALKLITKERAGDDSFRARFKRESQLAALIDHPNIIPVYEAGEAGGVLFIAMRFVDGVDLRALLEREALDPERVVDIVEQLAAALDAAHRRGLVHRDVKPANVLVANEGGREHVYLTDFGLSKYATSVSGVTQTGIFVGTIHYVAPEQIRGEKIDGRADVYALGCVLYHALTGVVPFDRDSDVATMHAHLNDPPPQTGVDAMDAVIERALAKDAAARFATAGELASAAREALRSAAPSEPEPTPSPWPRRGRIALGALLPTVLVAGLVAAGLAAAGFFDGDDEQQPEPTPTATATPTPTPTPRPDPEAVATIPVGNGPDGLVVEGDRVFVVNADDGTLTTIDAGDESAVGTPLPVGTNPDGVAAGGDVVWVTSVGDDQVQRIEASADLVPTASIDVGDTPQGISLGEQLAWVANATDGTVTRIDRATATDVGGPIGVGTEPTGVFVGRDTVWITNKGDDTVQRVDVTGATPVGEPIPVGDKPHGVVEADDSVWVANTGDGSVTRIDRVTGEVIGEPIEVGREPRELTVGRGVVWVANTGDNSVTRIDRNTGRVVGSPIPVGKRPLGIDVGAGGVWVANHGDGTVTRIRP
jgi:DNA-binding beta-propeller fold protein YncE/predicted Ser/Thr protein kinase